MLVYCVFCQKGISIEVERRLIQFVLGPGIWDRGETAANCCPNDLWLCYFALWRRRIFARKVWKKKNPSPQFRDLLICPKYVVWMEEKSREPFDQRGEILKIRKPSGMMFSCDPARNKEMKNLKGGKGRPTLTRLYCILSSGRYFFYVSIKGVNPTCWT